jgi:hypothetical protein
VPDNVAPGLAAASSHFLEENAHLGLAPATATDAATLRFLEENIWLAADASR